MTVPILADQPNAAVVNPFYPELHATFVDYFENHYNSGVEDWIKSLFHTETVDGAYFSAQTYLNAPLPMPRIDGEEPPLAGFGSLTGTWYIQDYWTPKLQWSVNALQDERAPLSFRTRIEESARYLANLQHYVFDELLLASASTYLHPDVSFTTIFGSTGLFSNSHTYNSQTWDNLLGGTGTDVGNIIDDVYSMQKNFKDAVDSNGRPFWNGDRISKARWLFVIPTALEQVFDQAFKQKLLLESGATAPSSNYLMDVFGTRVEVKVHQPLSDTDDWYGFLTNEVDGSLPLMMIDRKGVTPKFWRMADGNQESLNTHYEAVQWWKRAGFGIKMVHSAAKMVN